MEDLSAFQASRPTRGTRRTDSTDGLSTTVAGGHVRARVHIAVAWPPVLPDTAAAVRTNVTEQLRTLAGLTVDAVDVAVTAVVHDITSSSRTRSVQ